MSIAIQEIATPKWSFCADPHQEAALDCQYALILSTDTHMLYMGVDYYEGELQYGAISNEGNEGTEDMFSMKLYKATENGPSQFLKALRKALAKHNVQPPPKALMASLMFGPEANSLFRA